MKTIPNVTASRPGDHILIIVPNHWARSETTKEAKAKVRRQSGVSSKDWVVYSVHPETYVDDWGYIVGPANYAPIELARSQH